jgi:hypothetical protein
MKKIKEENLVSGKKLPWHFGCEDEFYPAVILPIVKI